MSQNYIKDSACTRDTPVVHGRPRSPIYGAGVVIRPQTPGKQDTDFARKIYLPELLPLEDYDHIIVLFSGGKDSMAAYFHLLELGVPKERLELWHHNIDGGHPSRRMDWPVTANYVRSFAQAEGVRLRVSSRVNGYWGEVYRLGASYPIEYEDDSGQVSTCPLSEKQKKSARLREQILTEFEPDIAEQLKEFGCRMKFPAKAGDLSRRWCSANLKIDVAAAVLRNLESLGRVHKFSAKGGIASGRYCSPQLKREVGDSMLRHLSALQAGGGRLKPQAKPVCHRGRWGSGSPNASIDVAALQCNAKILVVSGERRGESAGRAKYNEMELHRTHATARAHRLVHQWRAVIDYSERDVWEVLRRHRVTPHPCYACGWNRCSCMLCIFGLPCHWAGIRELFPEEYELVRQDEIRLGFTLDNKKDLDTYVGDAKSCVYRGDPIALHQLVTGQFTPEDVYCSGDWSFPNGAFRGADGGPC